MKNIIYILIFAFLLNFLPVFSQNNKIDYISKSQFAISVINPMPKTNPSGAYYPGVRGANQLIIYTSEFGETTQTNEYGAEAVIADNIVVKLSGSNSYIPQNGIVISGHGKAKNWIQENLIVGAVVNIDKKNMVIESKIVPTSYTYQAEQKINKVNETIAQYKQAYKSYYQSEIAEQYLNNAKEKLNEAKCNINQRLYDKAQISSSQSIEFADVALYHTVPAIQNEFHGIWLRPVEKNREEIVKTLDRIKSAGIDNVFVETYYHGYTVFPSKTMQKYGITPQRKNFEGWDPLKVWIEEAHKRDMKYHVWFQTFYAGGQDKDKNPNHIISVFPKWANVQKRNYQESKPMPHLAEHSGYFLDPANPEVQMFLSELISEIVNNYDVDGINIDYIRYPVSLQRSFPNYLESTWGYTDYARKEFVSIYGVDPVTLTTDSNLWDEWVSYRQSQVTEFVSKIKPLVKNKNILVSSVIFPDPEEGPKSKLQNWIIWGNSKLVDAFTPLVMGSDEMLAYNHVNQIKTLVGNNVAVYPGLFEPFGGGSPSDMLYQIKASRSAGASGIAIFDYAHLSKEFITALKTRVFKNK